MYLVSQLLQLKKKRHTTGFGRMDWEHIVKNEITVKFGLNEDNKAEQYASLARGQGYEPDRKIAVHAGTLRTTLRDYHQKGGSIPAELFTTFEGNQTEIKTKN